MRGERADVRDPRTVPGRQGLRRGKNAAHGRRGGAAQDPAAGA